MRNVCRKGPRPRPPPRHGFGDEAPDIAKALVWVGPSTAAPRIWRSDLMLYRRMWVRELSVTGGARRSMAFAIWLGAADSTSSKGRSDCDLQFCQLPEQSDGEAGHQRGRGGSRLTKDFHGEIRRSP